MSIDYENPWIYRDRQFSSDDIGEFYGFVYNITNLTNQRQYIGRKYFYQHRTPKGKKRKVKSESNWKKYYGSCPELKEDIELLGRQNFSRTILILHKNILAKQTLKKQDNSLSTESSPNPLTQEDLHTTIVTSSAGTSEKITMMETEQIVSEVRQWAIDKVQEYNGKGIERIYDQLYHGRIC